MIIRSGPLAGRKLKLGDEPFKVGRDPNCSLPLSDPKASRVHAEIVSKGDVYIVRDLKSRNGVKVNGKLVTALTLAPGDKVEIGDTVLELSLAEEPAGSGGRRMSDSALIDRAPIGAAPVLPVAKGSPEEATPTFETLRLEDISLLKAARSGDDHSTRVKGRDEDAKAAAEAERVNRALRALFDIGRACAESRSPGELFSALSRRLSEAVEADRVTPIVLHEEGWQPYPLPQDPSSPRVAKVPLSRTIVEHARDTSLAVLTNPEQDDRFADAASVSEQGIKSALCVPIVCEKELLGLIYVDRLSGVAFDKNDLELVSAAALQAAPTLRNLLRLERAITAKERMARELREQYNLLGESEPMQAVLRFIERAAPTNAGVLILGESGTGKELVARATHYQSGQADGPIVVVNCAALSESLVESELFGHAKGAFTGASGERAGRFEAADGGTIFLDEIGELSANCQTKLLRVLEQGELSRVGETRVRKVHVRVIAATNRDLDAEVKAGRFREDLFYRLNVLVVKLPPLRERGGDVELLLDHFLAEYSKACGRAALRLAKDARAALVKYRWPGNVREMKNVIERLAVLAPEDEVGVKDLPREVAAAGPAEGAPAGGTAPGAAAEAWEPLPLNEVEKRHIVKVLAHTKNNKKQAADILGIDRSTLYAKLKAYGIGEEG